MSTATPADLFALAADLLDPPDTDLLWLPGDPPLRHSAYVPQTNPDGTPRLPHPPQRTFLGLECEEAFYGGAAGGGKSDALLMAALQYVDVPGYAALLLRKTFTDLELPGAIMDRAVMWLAGRDDVRWNENKKRFTFPSGATLTFGYLQTARDKFRYQGAEFQFVGFDELTQFEEADYTYLASRLRRPEVGPLSLVPLRLRGAANPGGRGHRWVKRRLIERQPNPDDPDETPESIEARRFVPAKLDDNPSVDQEAYRAQLKALDPQTRAQLLNGDWNAREPGDWVFPIGLDETMALGAHYDTLRTEGRMVQPTTNSLVVATDFGTHTHILLMWPLEQGGYYVPQEIVYEHRQGANVKLVVPAVTAAASALGHPIDAYRFDGSQPVLATVVYDDLTAALGRKPAWMAVPFNKFKTPTIDYLKLLVANTMTYVRAGFQVTGPDAQPPYLAVSEKGCPVLADQLRGWQYIDVDAGRIDKHDDHGPDALVAGAAPDAAARRKP